MSSASSTPATIAPPRQQILGPGVMPVTRKGVPRFTLGDAYHVVLTMRWSLFMAAIVGSQVLANAGFAALYSLEDANVSNAHGPVDLFFFSVQTWATIGYGGMTPVTAWANTLVVIESITAIVFTAVTTGLVFAKFARPTARVRFANEAVITRQNGKDMLMLRVANERGNQVVEAAARVTLMRDEVTQEGQEMRRLYDLTLVRDVQPVFAVSWTVMHEIDERSPFAGMDEAGVRAGGWLLIFNLTGHDGTLAQTIHATHYYGAANIHFGARYHDTVRRLPSGALELDLTRFDDWEPQQVPARP
ncbi:MAG: ATP-sensitive inward rectifier potassium channel 10 [Deltaproteobacteria bacterium]|nr:ATP-sensitive inward rectifier potassium channel 10 [Deltaproteobacteria bacterium]